MVEDLDDPRRTEPVQDGLGERAMLEGWLEFHRATLLLKVEGLDDERRKARPVPSSKLSLHGLVRHMAEVERGWFWRCLERAPEVPDVFLDPAVEDSELVPLDEAIWADDLAAWEEECERSRRAAAFHGLDDTGVRDGRQVSLRWIYAHMVEEYARHNGHADLIRELVDGAVGY